MSRYSKENTETVAGCIAVVIFLVAALLYWPIQSHFEAAAFNRATGKNVSTWDAMWVELRVEGQGK